MPITMFTATPGAGKTQRIVEDILNIRTEEERQQKPHRTIITNISGLDPSLSCLTPDIIGPSHWENWWDAPDGTLFVIDECQKTFPTRNSSQRPPQWIEMLAEHRHRGFDFWIITQSPKFVDPFVRELVSSHWDGYRPHGLPHTIWSYYGYCELNPVRRVKPLKEKRKFNKEIFKFYKSTTVDTYKTKLPWKQISKVVVGFLVAVSMFSYAAYRIAEPAMDIKNAQSQKQQKAGDSKSAPLPASAAKSVEPAQKPADVFANREQQKQNFIEKRQQLYVPAPPARLDYQGVIAFGSEGDKNRDPEFIFCDPRSPEQRSKNAVIQSRKNEQNSDKTDKNTVSARDSDTVAASTDVPVVSGGCINFDKLSKFWSIRYDYDLNVILIYATRVSKDAEFYVSDPKFFRDLDVFGMLQPQKFVYLRKPA